MTSIARLIIRLTVGGLLVGHGAQKLFGVMGGSGLHGTAGWMESMNLRPGRPWAFAAGGSELVGGALTALGALNPLGPIMAMGSMLMATLKVHLGKPIWVTAGGAELPVINLAVLSGLFLAGPGRLSFDGLLGIRVPRWFSVAALLGMLGVTILAAVDSGLADPPETPDGEDAELEAGAALAGGDEERMGERPGRSETSVAPDGSWGAPDPGEDVPLMDDPAVTSVPQGDPARGV